jgi:hypothetical protein
VRILGVLLACLFLPAPAFAGISPVAPIDGPSPDIVDFGGAAMAPDGTGGVVYRKRVDGAVHIFAAQFDGQNWRAPQRVDGGQRFESSWPTIGAGNNGRLVVAWVQEFGPSSDRMYSAALDPGATRFQAPVPVDLNVGESTGTYPSVAMNAGGNALIAYLVLQAPTSAEPPGYARGELRVARYDGTYWSGIGFPLNRNVQAPLPLPTPGTSPRVAIDATGNGILAWQEPDDQFIDRIWARRLFGSNTGIATQVSAPTWNALPLRAPAEQFSLDTAGFGQGAIAYRQLPASGGPLVGTRIMLATIPETSAPGAAAFGAPRIVDGAGAAAPPVDPGPPAVAVDRVGDTLTAFGFAQRSLLVGADDKTIQPSERLDDGRSAIAGTPAVDVAQSGAAVAAWVVRRGGAGGIGLTERRADNVPVTQTVSAPVGGAVTTFALAGSGLGDGLVGWAQGATSNRQIAAAVVDAPPDPFGAQAPQGWVRTVPELVWDMPAHAIGGVTFSVTLDDDTVAENVRGTRVKIKAADVADGDNVLQVIAEDSAGQETTSLPAELKVDRRKPRATIKRYRNRLVQVKLSDGPRSSTSGVTASTVKVSWGDGKRGSGRKTLSHRYSHSGRLRITVTAKDAAGNTLKSTKTVTL